MEKVNLPIKTKIAAWWMIIIGGSVILFCLGGVIDAIFGCRMPEFMGALVCLFGLIFLIIVVLPVGLLFFIPGIFLLKKKRWAWWFIEIILFLGLIAFLKISISPIEEKEILKFLLSFIIPPFFLLLLDRKNFWKIAS